MSQSSESPTDLGRNSQELRHDLELNNEDHERLGGTARDHNRAATTAPRRSEVLRHVFPRPLLKSTAPEQKSSPSVTKPHFRRTSLSSFRRSRSRVAFHRVITSIFHNSPIRAVNNSVSSQQGSGASSLRSRANSLPESIPSLEVVSPGTFLFSGPSLKSTRSGSLSNCTSIMPSLSGSETQSLRHVRSESLSAESGSLLEDVVLEPLVECGITRSMSDVLLGISTPFEEIETPILEDPNEDAIVLPDRAPPAFHGNSPCLTQDMASLLLPYLDFKCWKALRLTCRSWVSAVTSAAPPVFPSSYFVPNEILQDIFGYLGPKDFNAARHSCRTWMRASLERSLLLSMLKRGGWWSAVEQALHMRNEVTEAEHVAPSNNEWILSQYLSRECSLSADWTGNGLYDPGDERVMTGMSSVDFTELANGSSALGSRYGAGLIFQTSICGQVLLVANDTLIYVYALRGSSLRALTSVACPRRVLALSMDITAGRYAVAALLEGRMGMVCELRYGYDQAQHLPIDVHVGSHERPIWTTSRASILTSRASEFEGGIAVASRDTTRSRRAQRSSLEYLRSTTFSSVGVHGNHEAIILRNTDDRQANGHNWINQTWNLNLRGVDHNNVSRAQSSKRPPRRQNIPIENGTTTFYRHLCSEDDPPRSVAICPQRRCVAFGCSAGIELHWIDALTGQSLSRWFPLTAPSDYLYFLPPRPGFESGKKLRLISSAAHPDDRPAISRKFFNGRPTINTFWSSFGYDSRRRNLVSSSCDHYHAVPLNDGHHILFIDPLSDKLYLGCDAPLGGPTKLLRKIIFVPPEDEAVPRLYTAATNLDWGARVVVTFGDRIMLYSIPPDVLALSKMEQQAESWDVYTAPRSSDGACLRDHWLNWWEEPTVALEDICGPIWPLGIRGTEIGSMHSICDLAIFTRPDITIWAFALDAKARAWKIRHQEDPVPISRHSICRSGLVHDPSSIDTCGDAVTTGAEDLLEVPEPESSDSEYERTIGFDGNCSGFLAKRLPKALSVENDDWVDCIDVRGCDAWYDASGDVIMFNSVDDVGPV